MIGAGRVKALEEDWKALLDGVARAHRWPTTDDVARLGLKVLALSRAYNLDGTAGGDDALAARLLFSFPRDVPKGAAAVRELAAHLRPELRVLDIGAGLGATTWGLARALGPAAKLVCTWVDIDPRAMDLGAEIVRARPGSIELRSRLKEIPRGSFDVVLLGQVLSEMDHKSDHARFVEELLATRVAEDGALVIVEPALRERTRHLHRVRDALVDKGVNVFAPCLHRQACPMLPREGDWCHEDLEVDLPPWLVPVARAAGLRWQGLTFSYLVLRRDTRSMPRALRVVSDLRRTKGKSEAFVCGETVRGRLARLDRDRAPSNEDWDELVRGDVIAVSPPPDPVRPRVDKASEVSRNAT